MPYSQSFRTTTLSPETPLRILIVESRFYEDLSDELLAGAKDALEAHGIDYDVVTVPGAFELPAAIAMAPGRFSVPAR